MRGLRKNLRLFFDRYWGIILIVVVVFSFFWKVIFRGLIPLPGDFIAGVYYPWLDYKWGFPVGVPVKNPMTSDVVSLIFPEQMLGVDLMKLGTWPLWNPYILAGTPLLANLQAAPFSPTIFVYFLFEKLTAWSLQIMLQHILVGVFTYILLRHWKVTKLGSVFGGVAFSFSGFNMIFSEWNGHALSAAFIPLTVYFFDKWLLTGRVIDGIGLSVASALQVLSGYPQVSFYTAFALSFLWLVRFFENKRVIMRRTLPLAFFVLLALGLSAVQLLPAAELWYISQRSYEPHPYEWAFLPWTKIITFIAPDYFGNHATANYWGPQDYTSNTGFVGVVSLFVALISLTKLRKNRVVLYLVLLTIFSLLMAFPTPLPIWLWRNNIFGMRAAYAHRITVLFNFSIACLAAQGVDILLRTKRAHAKLSLLVLYLLLGVYGVVTLYFFITTRGNIDSAFVRGIPKYQVALRNLVFPVGILLATTIVVWLSGRLISLRKFGIVVLFGLMLSELFRFGWKFTPFTPRFLAYPETPVTYFLANQEGRYRVTGNRVIPTNMKTPYGIESLEGYETIHTLRISQFLAAVNSGNVGTQPVGRYGMVDDDTSHLLDLTNTRYYLELRRDSRGNPSLAGEIPSRFLSDRFERVFEDKTTVVIQSKSVLPRAFLVYDWEIVKDDREILTKLLDQNFPMSSKVILEEEPELVQVGESRELGNKSSVNYLEYKAQESEIEVDSEKDGILFVSDAYYPGWRAYVDGIETKIYRADFAFRAVEVPGGTHEVQFKYKPDSFSYGLTISVLCLVFLLLRS